MDLSNPDDWMKLETAFASAPRWAIIVATGATVGLIVWWVRGTMFNRERANLLSEKAAQKADLEGEKSILEQRLKLAADQTVKSDKALEELKKEFEAYKMDVVAKGSKASPAKVDAAIVGVANGNTDIRSSLSGMRRNLEFQNYEALKNLDGFGALRKLDPDALDKIKDIGKPLGTTLNSIPEDLNKRD